MKNFGIAIGAGAVLALSALLPAAASAAEAFAEPGSAKSGRFSYQLSAFVGANEDGVSFTFELPKGASNVSVANCGRDQRNGMAKCHYEPSTGKLAVVLIRLDGQPLDASEYQLGQVEFSAPGIRQLPPIEIATQSGSRAGGVSSAARPTPARREN